jgi:hypothetical protein
MDGRSEVTETNPRGWKRRSLTFFKVCICSQDLKIRVKILILQGLRGSSSRVRDGGAALRHRIRVTVLIAVQ